MDPTSRRPPTLAQVQLDMHKKGMTAIKLNVFGGNQPSPVDIFIPIADRSGNLVNIKRICPHGQALQKSMFSQLEKAGLRTVCVRTEEVSLLLEDIKNWAEDVLGSNAMNKKEKASYLAEMASMSVRLMFIDLERNIERIEEACDLARQSVELLLKEKTALESLAGILVTSRTVYDHSVNVCLMSMMLGRRIGLDQYRLLTLGLGALVHDAGLAKVPATVRDKPGALTDDELSLVRKHPTWGHQFLSKSSNIPDEALEIVLGHHERFDGKGYPNGLVASDIPLFARLVRVVDIYDALTSPRPHRKALAPSLAAASLLKEDGDNLDKKIIVEFIRMQGEAFT